MSIVPTAWRIDEQQRSMLYFLREGREYSYPRWDDERADADGNDVGGSLSNEFNVPWAHSAQLGRVVLCDWLRREASDAKWFV
jgi:hypothetical protein